MNLTVKGLPEELGTALKRAAESSHRSLNGEIVHRLVHSFDKPTPELVSRLAESPEDVANAWTKLADKWQSDLTLEDEIAALYANRSAGRDVDVSW
jgi:plasmid stability protein